MRRERFLVDVREAGRRHPTPGGESAGIAGYVILVLVLLFIIGTCS